MSPCCLQPSQCDTASQGSPSLSWVTGTKCPLGISSGLEISCCNLCVMQSKRGVFMGLQFRENNFDKPQRILQLATFITLLVLDPPWHICKNKAKCLLCKEEFCKMLSGLTSRTLAGRWDLLFDVSVSSGEDCKHWELLNAHSAKEILSWEIPQILHWLDCVLVTFKVLGSTSAENKWDLACSKLWDWPDS